MFVALRASCLALACYTACEASDLAAAAGPDRAEAAVPGSGRPSGTGSPADTRQAKPVTESDRLSLRQAAAACRERDGNAFFDAFTQSGAARRKYSAPKITFSLETQDDRPLRRTDIAASRYKEFPIMMVDYYRKPVRPLRAGDDDEYVEISIYQSHQNQLAVGWARVHYDGKSEGGDDLGNPVTLDGKPYDPAGPLDGQLLFHLTSDCWELVSDIRYENHAAP
jgi:hypothetical protein